MKVECAWMSLVTSYGGCATTSPWAACCSLLRLLFGHNKPVILCEFNVNPEASSITHR